MSAPPPPPPPPPFGQTPFGQTPFGQGPTSSNEFRSIRRPSPVIGRRTTKSLVSDDEESDDMFITNSVRNMMMSGFHGVLAEDTTETKKPASTGVSFTSSSTVSRMPSVNAKSAGERNLTGGSADPTSESPAGRRRQFAQGVMGSRMNISMRAIASRSDGSRPSLSSHLSRRSTAIRNRMSATQLQPRVQSGVWDDNGFSLVRSTVRRTYNVGDYVLVSVQHSRIANLVNRFGFPPGEGETPEEQQGPYSYVLAKIKHKHFEEVAIFYTVNRCDTWTDQRADQEYMEPIRGIRGEMAAKRAAQAHTGDTQRDAFEDDEEDYVAPSNFSQCCQAMCYCLLLPFLWLYDWLLICWLGCFMPTWIKTLSFLKNRASLLLNGHEPYVCRLRLTVVNVMVLCSVWLTFIDQARLAFFPPVVDNLIASVNLAVWITLVLELVFEVFILPDGFKNLIVSDKAYAPATVQYMNRLHLCVESFSLLVFIPEFLCVLRPDSCSSRYGFSFYNAVLMGIVGPKRSDVFFGHAYLALIRLRVFGLVRHWRNMWITNTFVNMKWRTKRAGLLAMLIPSKGLRTFHDRQSLIYRNKLDADAQEEKIKELTLINASNIGTALMITNSYRAMIILCTITGLFPLLVTLSPFKMNSLGFEMTNQLQSINLVANDTSAESCGFLVSSVDSWTKTVSSLHYDRGVEDGLFLVGLKVEPYRCNLNEKVLVNFVECKTNFERINGTVVTGDCRSSWWSEEKVIAEQRDIRQGSLVRFSFKDADWFSWQGMQSEESNFSVTAIFDHSAMIKTASLSSLLLQIVLLLSILGGLSFLRRDAEILVLGPLRRMLKIVARYAKNPLVPPKTHVARHPLNRKESNASLNDGLAGDSDDEADAGDAAALGTYEAEQLITAVTNITDLLRKCWGVAGADIISTNLATREGALEVFNPTVPGKSVYALFAFAAISGFDHALRNLKGDVMKLINDVAKVLHDEVFRWGFGESGQCNKNLGSAFLMVFRIGLVEEVIEKLEQAQDVIWSGQTPGASRRRVATQKNSKNSISSMNKSSQEKKDRRVATKAMSLSLQSLPGISTFTDRAVVGMLKSFAGIYRDSKVMEWSKDFRLSAGVGAFKVSLIYGMDAGWAVEGAVGSEYKIDATYLSPHVNMASRMTGACKQYGVTIMLSQAVQELMSETARGKLRHLDTVTVKGSSVVQKIYTYDCKSKGVDFFLYGRSDEQADIDAHQFSPEMWTTDQDLRAMGQHVTEDFLRLFREGHRAYIKGDWPKAIEILEKANDSMFEAAVEQGYLEDEFDELQIYAGQDFTKAADDLKRENGDGPSIFLIQYMKSYGGVAPDDWEGWHPLTRK